MILNKDKTKKIVRENIQGIKNFEVSTIDFNEAGTWPLLIKIIFISIICAFIVYFSNNFYIKGLEKNLETSSKKETELLEKIMLNSHIEPTIKDYENQLEILKNNLKTLASKLPEKIEMSSILDEMTLIANRNNVLISSINLEREEEKENYIELPFKIEAKGKFHNFAAFLSELSRMNRIVTIHDVGIQPDSSSKLLNLELIAKTYKYKQVDIEKGDNNE